LFNLNSITVKNFMSVGNSTQAIDFNRQDLTLVLGENLDLGGDDTGARNGTGKTTIINALSYALYGQALTKIRADNLINKTNGKNMLVCLEFEKNNKKYKIERGRKSNLLKFYVDGQEQEAEDNAQGDSRETQAEINRLLEMSHEMFKHVVALNTYTEPFLSLKSNDQRAIIEQLLGITLLSEKAEKLKEEMKINRDRAKEEEYRIQGVERANEHIKEQIEKLKRSSKLWEDKKDEDIQKLQKAIIDLGDVDIDKELEQHTLLAEWNEQQSQINSANSWIESITSDNNKNDKHKEKLTEEIKLLEEHKCHACGQEIHDNKQEEIIKSKQEQVKGIEEHLLANKEKFTEYSEILKTVGELGDKPETFYPSITEAHNHKTTLTTLENELSNKTAEENSYLEQIKEMEENGIQEINFDELNNLNFKKEHQEFLQKLLTSKDSFVRKRIIEQNLAFLNKRLTYYLNTIGLPHKVVFQNDLSIEITELGRDLDFDNLSRGERNRLILSLSWSFRDVWENLYQPINLLFIDELVDSGMDASGVESSLAVLKKMSRDRKKSIWLISHRDELAGRVNNVLTVQKENGFTSYNNDVKLT
jgi:DNA repair exonuclease SbcCD ATPase subunit